MHEQYDWTPSTCAPKLFPVTVLGGGFKLVDGSTLPLSKDSYTGNGWGEIGSLMLVGEDSKPVPDSLSVNWFSYKERKFYRCTFDLDKHKLEGYFKTGYSNPITGEHTTYKYILVGFAPAGGVSVWLCGNGLSKEVAYMKADAYAGDINTLIGAAGSLEEFVQLATDGKLSRAEIQPIKIGDTEYKKWSAEYRYPYNFQLNIATGAVVKSATIQYFNGEKIQLSADDLRQFVSEKSLPRRLLVRWVDANNENTTTEIDFDEAEIFAAFEHLPKINNAPLKLQAVLNAVSFECTAYIENGINKITLGKIVFKTF